MTPQFSPPGEAPQGAPIDENLERETKLLGLSPGERGTLLGVLDDPPTGRLTDYRGVLARDRRERQAGCSLKREPGLSARVSRCENLGEVSAMCDGISSAYVGSLVCDGYPPKARGFPVRTAGVLRGHFDPEGFEIGAKIGIVHAMGRWRRTAHEADGLDGHGAGPASGGVVALVAVLTAASH